MISLIAKTARSVQDAVHWLKLNESAILDARDCAITISALVAAEKSAHAVSVQRLTRKLRDANPDGISWNDEVWDTVWAARALLDAKLPRTGVGRAGEIVASDALVRSAIDFLKAVRDRIRGFWYGEPFETMLALDLLSLTDDPEFAEIADQPIEWLLSLQGSDGRVIAPHFTGIFASVFSRIKLATKPALAEASRRAADWLVHDLDAHPIWTSAAWSNAHALQGLLDTRYSKDHPAVVRAVEWFIATQSSTGEWSHVAAVDDTSMAVLALTPMLSDDLFDVTPPREGTISAIRTNGAVRLTFEGGSAGSAIIFEDFVKLPEEVADEIRNSELEVLDLATRVRGAEPIAIHDTGRDLKQHILDLGAFAHGHLFAPTLIENSMRDSRVDHLRLSIDERLIELPWELIYDGDDFLCLRFAIGRQIYAPTAFREVRPRKERPRALVVSDPGSDLPGALAEGKAVARLLLAHGVEVTQLEREEATKQKFAVELKRHDIIHYAGHAIRDEANPDESCVVLADGPFKAFRLSGFFGRQPPVLVFLNACWSASERSAGRGYPTMMRGLGRTFVFAGVANFIGYLIPVSDRLATDLALHFYSHLVVGRSVGEALRRSRMELRDHYGDIDPIWASAVLYGDPTAAPISHPRSVAHSA